jgi:hypothetical protein
MAHILLAALTVLAIAPGAQTPTTQFSPAGIDDPKLVDDFLADLQQAVAADDADKVASLGRYPVTVVIDKKRRKVKTKDELKKLYPQIFTPCLKRLVAAARTDDLFANYQGVMFSGGAMWFGLQGSRRMLFYTINGPSENEPLCTDATP